jgi:hypothetical protein
MQIYFDIIYTLINIITRIFGIVIFFPYNKELNKQDFFMFIKAISLN